MNTRSNAATMERRVDTRRNVEGFSVVSLTGHDNAYIRDISVSGLFIRTESPDPVGSTTNLRFSVILDQLVTVEGTGLVVRSVPPGGLGPAGMAVRFTRLTTVAEDAIVRVVSGEL